MTEESFGPLTEDEAQDFAAKLGQLSGNLSAKERWFLSEVLARGVENGRIESEVQGYGVGTNVFYPTGMGSGFGAQTTQTSTAGYMKISEFSSFVKFHEP